MTNENDADARHNLLFLNLIAMFQTAAMQHLGKIFNPLTNTMERDLEQAQLSIDILDMLKAKTRGNLSASEQDFLDKVVFELHMNYVDEAGKPEEAKTEPEPAREAGEAREQEHTAASQQAEAAPDTQPGQSKKPHAKKRKPKGGGA